jgi:hypothetical protein
MVALEGKVTIKLGSQDRGFMVLKMEATFKLNSSLIKLARNDSHTTLN